MFLRSSHPAFALAIAALAACCTSMPGERSRIYERRLPLPADLAAALGAGAVRTTLPFADPMPDAAGAPARRDRAGRFSIDYQRDASGDWLPRASVRLSVSPPPADPSADAVVAVQDLADAHRLPGLGDRAAARLLITVQADAEGCVVSGSLPADVADQLEQVLDHAFALARDPRAPEQGLAEPNLRALVCQRLLASANVYERQGEQQRAEEQLQRALRLQPDQPALHARLGQLAARSGDVPFARDQFQQALLLATDPTTRAHLARQLASLDATSGDRAGLQRAARDRVAVADLDGAARLLHTARRRAPEPATDYELLSHLHARRNDDMGALSCALLARENAPIGGVVAGVPSLRRGLADLVRHATKGITVAGAAAPQPSPDQPAAPAR